MHTPPESDVRKREQLSALIDGQAAPDERAAACAAWRDDADARASWHAFALIGDVMRSDELAASPGRDEAFLRAMRTRLAAEPVPLAALRAARSSVWRRLTAPAAMAAGFAVVAGAVIVLRPAPVQTDSTTLAALGGRGDTGQPMDTVSFVRDSHIDSYLEAHRQQSIRRVALPEGAVMRRIDAVVVEPR